MSKFTILVLAFSPGIFWLWYFYRKDRLEPEPKHLIVKTFFLGMLAALPAILLELPFSGMMLTVAAAPIVEEYVKYFVVRRTVYNSAEFNEPMDGIVYAAAAALGFASAENAIYLFTAYYSPQRFLISSGAASASGAVLNVFVYRAVLSVPGHVLFSSMWGYALGQAKFTGEARGGKLIRNGLLLSIFLHGLFNFVVSIGPAISLGMLVFLVVTWRMVFRKIARALADSPHASGPSPATSGLERQDE